MLILQGFYNRKRIVLNCLFDVYLVNKHSAMKKLIITLKAVVLFTACSQPASTEQQNMVDVKNENPTLRTDDTGKVKVQAVTNSTKENSTEQQSIPRLYEEIKSSNDLPSWLEIKYKGQIKFGAKWKDNAGENVLLINTTEPSAPDKNEERSMELFAMHYTYKDKKRDLVWNINDIVKCGPIDMDLFYVPYSFNLTDLNGDGVRETLFMYQLMCRGDVSEDNLKLIMHDGKIKYAIRGTTKVNTGNEIIGGKLEADKSFDSAPNGFKEHAINVWNKLVDTNKRVQ